MEAAEKTGNVAIDFLKARDTLMAVIDCTLPSSEPLEVSRERVLQAASGLPTVSKKEDEKLEVSAEIKTAAELAFRTWFDQRLVALRCVHSEQQTARLKKIPIANEVPLERLLQLSILCSEEGLVEPSLPPYLLQDLMESQTTEECEKLFGLLESNSEALARICASKSSNPKLILLRLCIELLRRLSKSAQTAFSGRILMFLAHIVPLSDRSGLNLKSEVNLLNVTTFEETPVELQFQDEPDGPPIDFNFYKNFWSLQSYFQNPAALTNMSNWNAFLRTLEAVLSAFASIPIPEEASVRADDFCAIKYLTSSRLIRLQLKDPTFRRHFLLQLLILFQSLTVPASKTTTIQLKELQRAHLADLQKRVKEALEKTPPNGPQFSETVHKTLQRELNWVQWKRENCPPFEKPPLPTTSSTETKRKREADGADTSAPVKKERKIRLGNTELNRLWSFADAPLDDPERMFTPSLDDYLRPLAEELKPDSGVEEKYSLRHNKVYIWKALRLIAKSKLHYFSKMENGNLEPVLRLEQMIDDKKQLQQSDDVTSFVDTKVTQEETRITAAGEENEEEKEEGATVKAESTEEAADHSENGGTVAAAEPMDTESTAPASNEPSSNAD